MYWSLDPVALAIGPLAIRWYSLSWLAAVLLIMWGCNRTAKRLGWRDGDMDNLVFFGFVGAFVGGRLGYVVFYNLGNYLSDPLAALAIWQGGMSFHGGLIGCSLALVLWARSKDRGVMHCFDLAALWMPLGIFSVRVGNFLNGELWGRPTDLPWAVVFEADPEQLPRHPSQLYEALFEGLLLFALVQVVGRRWGPPGGSTGVLTGLFLSGYATARIALEFVRQPDAHIGFDVFGWVTRGQWLSLPLLLLGLAVLLLALQGRWGSVDTARARK